MPSPLFHLKTEALIQHPEGTYRAILAALLDGGKNPLYAVSLEVDELNGAHGMDLRRMGKWWTATDLELLGFKVVFNGEDKEERAAIQALTAKGFKVIKE